MTINPFESIFYCIYYIYSAEFHLFQSWQNSLKFVDHKKSGYLMMSIGLAKLAVLKMSKWEKTILGFRRFVWI